MDVFIECEVDLCNGDCPICEEDQKRKKRSLPRIIDIDKIPLFHEAVDKVDHDEEDEKRSASYENSLSHLKKNKTENANLKLARRLRVLSPEDIALNGDQFSSITLVSSKSHMTFFITLKNQNPFLYFRIVRSIGRRCLYEYDVFHHRNHHHADYFDYFIRTNSYSVHQSPIYSID